ncbi:MAG TPA: formate dehydrogenase accessory protein FdhE [Candidatus Acidoferrales bacterium]|nr:formate dehydrogenase accessory protein FdhE [Candidatus Acidoferrales bacterium]
MNRWQRRIERAEELARVSPVYPEVMNFYIQIARFQSAPPRNLEALKDLIRRSAPRPQESADAMHAFYARVLAQAEAEERAHAAEVKSGVQPLCPFCGEKPVAAVLRPEGEGGKRYLLCSLCFTEWEFRRLLCPNCGEEDKDKLPVYTAEEFPHVRVEACDSCRVYLKAVDLTKNGLAVPEVDELASVALDLWAAEHGYTKLQTNLFGL